MRAERLIMMIMRRLMRGDLVKMARGETTAKMPDKKRLTREAMKMARRAGRL